MAQLWNDLYTNMIQLPLSIPEKMIRPVIVYFFLIFGLRLAGKRELAQLNPFDLVVLLTLSNTVQNAIIGNDNSVSGGIIGAATLLVVNALFVRFLYSHEKVDKFVEGDRVVLMECGKLIDDRLKSELITPAELEAAAHKQGFGSLDDVDHCFLETGGALSFIARKPLPEDLRQSELIARLAEIDRKLNTLVKPDAA